MKERRPMMRSKPAKRLKAQRLSKMMGRSVIRGLKATFIPSRALWRRVWEITSVNMGPGVRPAERPKRTPAVKAVNISTLLTEKEKQYHNHCV
jgi:hypothetical protein